MSSSFLCKHMVYKVLCVFLYVAERPAVCV
jgi:hypothetical protein